MEPNQKFKIIINSKECGTCSGSTPSAVTKKVVKKLCGSSSKVVKFSLKECKRGCEQICGPYQGRMEKLNRPYKRSGKTITHRVICGKVRKMRGGDLGDDGDLLTIDDFEVKDKNFPFLRLETIGKLGIFGLGSTKNQYAFFNPIKLNNNEQNQNNNEQNQNNNEQNQNNNEQNQNNNEQNQNNNKKSQAETEQMNKQTKTNQNPNYYQYVAIRKRDKNVIFKKLKYFEISEINISEIDTNILKQLLYEIKEEIKTKREINEKFDAKSIIDTLDEYLKNKISTNLKNDIVSWKLFKIEEKNPPSIKYFSFGKRTSKFGGNKNQYIFFDIIELYPHHFFYQYVVIRDENQKISLKKIVINENGVMEILDFATFDSVRSDKSGKGQLILEKLHRDILTLIDNGESSNFATTIRDKLSDYTSSNKVKHLFSDFKIGTNHIDFFVDKTNVFFNDNHLFIRCNELKKKIGNHAICEYTEEEYELYRKYYMYVMFLDKEKKIIFNKLILFKDTIIILEINMKTYKILEWLYFKINYLCDSKNNEYLFNILFALEEHAVYQERKLLKSRDFYITSQQQQQTIRILSKEKKTFIFFKRLKGNRRTNSNLEFILYEYAIIIDKNNIKYYTIKDPDIEILIKNIREIKIDDIDILLLTLLYEELIQQSGNNNNNNNNLKRLRELLYQKIGRFFNFKKKVEEILTSNIKSTKIIVNSKFTFDFFENENNKEELKNFLKRILQKKNIKMINNNKFKFKPEITSIVSKRNNNLINNQFTYNQSNNEIPII